MFLPPISPPKLGKITPKLPKMKTSVGLHKIVPPNILLKSNIKIPSLVKLKIRFWDFRGHSKNGGFYPLKMSNFQNLIFSHVDQ